MGSSNDLLPLRNGPHAMCGSWTNLVHAHLVSTVIGALSTMANKHFTIYQNYGSLLGNRCVHRHDDSSTSSPRGPNGLILTSNPHSWVDYRSTLRFTSPDIAKTNLPDCSYSLGVDSAIMAKLRNEALARFTGKVRKHNASLGVTLGSIKQSRDMIIDRTYKIADIFDYRIKSISKLTKAHRRRILIKGRASDYLEGTFGWTPLVQDIQASLGALGRDPPNGYFSARSKTSVGSSYVEGPYPGYYTKTITTAGNAWVTVGGIVKCNSPNTFLTNRLGLLNLPGVAWDLVPWSFVVNMFTNMGQLVNSVSDFVGIDLVSTSTTEVWSLDRTDSVVSIPFANGKPSAYGFDQKAVSTLTGKQRIRKIGLPSPTFQVRVPELNLELAGIAISLILQKFVKIERLLRA